MTQCITTRRELIELARELMVRPDWHEPDEQNLTARVGGDNFDNAMPPGHEYGEGHREMYVALHRTEWDGVKGEDVAIEPPVAVVNLASLFAWATTEFIDATVVERAARVAVLDEWKQRFARQAHEATDPTGITIARILADTFNRAREEELKAIVHAAYGVTPDEVESIPPDVARKQLGLPAAREAKTAPSLDLKGQRGGRLDEILKDHQQRAHREGDLEAAKMYREARKSRQSRLD